MGNLLVSPSKNYFTMLLAVVEQFAISKVCYKCTYFKPTCVFKSVDVFLD